MFKSTAGGATWSATSLIATTGVVVLVIDPQTPTTLYAGGAGVFSIQQVNPCGDGLVEDNEQCDEGAHNGQAGFCCSATCQFEAAATVYRAQAGACDVAETCTGTSAFCPANTFKASTTVCRPSFGACDVAETCTGTSAYCVANTFKASGAVCRPAVGACDVAESCTGTSASCPANGVQSNGTACDDGNAATCNDQCTVGSCAGTAC